MRILTNRAKFLDQFSTLCSEDPVLDVADIKLLAHLANLDRDQPYLDLFAGFISSIQWCMSVLDASAQGELNQIISTLCQDQCRIQNKVDHPKVFLMAILS